MKFFQKAVLGALILSITACSAPTETTKIVLQKADETMILKSGSLVSPYTFEETVETVYDTAPIKTVLKDMDSKRTGYAWLISKVSDGTHAYVTSTIRSTYDTKGNLLTSESVPESEIYTEATPTIYQYGAKVTKGAYFLARVITKYGYDCAGCNIALDGTAGTSADIRVKDLSVRQSDGSWKDGITYDGYYIVAADKAFPHCTILEISNHTFNGMGLESGVPFRALVLDRGSAITTNKLDLYVGSENRINVVTSGRTSKTKVTVVGFLKFARNSQGQRVCR